MEDKIQWNFTDAQLGRLDQYISEGNTAKELGMYPTAINKYNDAYNIIRPIVKRQDQKSVEEFDLIVKKLWGAIETMGYLMAERMAAEQRGITGPYIPKMKKQIAEQELFIAQNLNNLPRDLLDECHKLGIYFQDPKGGNKPNGYI